MHAALLGHVWLAVSGCSEVDHPCPGLLAVADLVWAGSEQDAAIVLTKAPVLLVGNAQAGADMRVSCSREIDQDGCAEELPC